MKRILLAGIGLFAASLLPATGHAQGTVKIGLILPYSGQFADTGIQMLNGAKLYVKQPATGLPARKSRSSPRMSAASIRRSPSVWRKSWSRATTLTSSPAST